MWLFDALGTQYDLKKQSLEPDRRNLDRCPHGPGTGRSLVQHHTQLTEDRQEDHQEEK